MKTQHNTNAVVQGQEQRTLQVAEGGGGWPGSGPPLSGNTDSSSSVSASSVSVSSSSFQQQQYYQQNGLLLKANQLYHPVSCYPYYYNGYDNNHEEMKNLITNFYPMQVPPKSKYVKHDSSEFKTVLPPQPPYTPNGREGIFWTTMALDECEAVRLRQLVETATSPTSKTQRDVWVLHSHYKYPPNSIVVQRSNELIASIPGLKSAPQTTIPVDPFDDSITSGTSKSSVLRMIIQERYTYGWQVENDVFFTGKWSDFFDVMSGNSDKYVEDYTNITNFIPTRRDIEIPFYGTNKFWEADVISGAISCRTRWRDK